MTATPASPGILARSPIFSSLRLTHQRLIVLWWATVAYAVVLLVAYLQGADGPLHLIIGTYVQYIPITAVAGLTMVHAAAAGPLLPGTRIALRYIAGGLLGMLVGMAMSIWVRYFSGVAYGSLPLVDVAYLLSYTALLAGLLKLPRRTPTEYEGWKVVIDASVLLVAVALLGWYFILRPTTVALTGPVDLFIRIAYPTLDIAFLFAVNRVLIAGGPADAVRGFRWLAGGVIAYVLAESLYQVLYYGTGARDTRLDLASEVLFGLSYLLFVGAAIRYALGGSARRRIPRALPMSPLSLIATAAVGVVLSVVALRNWSVPLSPLILGSVGLTTLVLFRQGLTVAQNATLLRITARRDGDARVAALVRHASDLIMVTGAAGVLRFVSPSSERILGATPQALTGRTLGSLVHPDDADALDALLADHPVPRTVELRLATPDGGWRELEVVATDLTEEAAVEGIVLVARDVTERNALEARLRQSQKMEAVGRLAGGVAHDFNNLLTTILVSTDLVLERELEGPVRDDLEVVRQATERAAGLTGQLLAFSRQDVRQRRPVDMNALVADTVKLLRRLLGSDVTVNVSAAADIPWVAGDANLLAQVIINLALNARDAMPRGGIVSIGVTPTIPHGGGAPELVLTIRDSGTGMSPTVQAHIFEPFFTTKAAGQGTGLGLATTARIVEQHGGTIAVDSELGLGTTVTITLPAGADSGVAAAPSATDDMPATGHEVILLVEDDESVRNVTRRILTRLGYTVVECDSAAAALEALDTLHPPPDLLLTDVMMPDMTGPELATVVAATHPDLRVLFVSGYPGDELRQLGIRADEVPFLQKPFTPRELGDCVREAIETALPRTPLVESGTGAFAYRSPD
ncbi:MAG: response regulator [Gemmatimonadales bacterium]|nr:response regulator [Gemmatimonadales bacterium]